MKIMKFIREKLYQWITKIDTPIFVNSYGRSGSTVLSNAILKSAIPGDNFLSTKISRGGKIGAWELDSINPTQGFLYKTHDYPQQNINHCNLRMLYTFADPVDVVLSLLRLFETKGESWMKEHYQHLNAKYGDFPKIIYEDQLGLEKHLNAWLNEERFPIAFIRYETMWKCQDDISDFLGFAVELPPYRKRQAANFNDATILESIKETYQPLQKKINTLDDFFVLN